MGHALFFYALLKSHSILRSPLFLLILPAMKKDRLITILGPTASGKTALAAALAERIDAEIISGDSRQVYRMMDIGTGKDLADYTVNGKKIPFHLIDIHDPGYKYNVFEYQHDFHKAYASILEKGKQAILCGGTGMYIEAVLKGFKLLDVPQNPALREALKGKSLAELERILASYKTLHNKTDVDSAQRAIRAIEIEEFYKTQAPDQREYAPIDSLIIGIHIERDARRDRVSKRLRERLAAGMIEEVQTLLAKGIAPEDLLYYGLEYKYLTQYVIGELTYEEMYRKLEIAIHQFAKRQMTWFRGMERRGIQIHWLEASSPMEDKVAQIRRWLSL